jgi:hypothetical protein
MSVSNAWETFSVQAVKGWPIHEREKLHSGNYIHSHLGLPFVTLDPAGALRNFLPKHDDFTPYQRG